MSVSTILSNISTINNSLTQLRKKLYETQKKKSDKNAEIMRIKKSITSNTSASSIKSKQDQINHCIQITNDCEKKEADIMKKIAVEEGKLFKKQTELNKARDEEQKKAQKMYNDNLQKQELSNQQLINELLTVKLNNNENQAIQQSKKYDFFISHASEDKDEVARPLYQALTNLGAEVWFDEFTMTIGDNLRKSIDKGLVNSKFGIVILSETFFRKAWTNHELDGLVQRQMVEEKVILPIWHKVSKDIVMQYSPSLAGLLALKTSDETVVEIAKKLYELVS